MKIQEVIRREFVCGHSTEDKEGCAQAVFSSEKGRERHPPPYTQIKSHKIQGSCPLCQAGLPASHLNWLNG